nr:GntR family transcriptional regulator [uncultured Allomuricauda sp.]
MEPARGKLGDIVQHCIYEIATGKWTAQQKLPSVREAEIIWGVNRLTVLAAYRELEKIGLVESKDRSGYYVIDNGENDVFDIGLNKLYGKLKNMIAKHTDLNLNYALRYFGALAISESKSNPIYAFLECTDHQAEGHTKEIFQKLNVPIHPVCLHDDRSLIPDIPKSVEILMTTGFHIREVNRIGKKLKKKVINIPIEVDPNFLKSTKTTIEKMILVELENNMSSNILNDVKKLVGKVKLEEKLISNIDEELLKLVKDPTNQLILLSPRVWGQASPTLKRDKRIKLIRFRISDASWKVIAQTLKIPLHTSKYNSININ